MGRKEPHAVLRHERDIGWKIMEILPSRDEAKRRMHKRAGRGEIVKIQPANPNIRVGDVVGTIAEEASADA